MFGPVLKGDHVTLRPADDSDPPRFLPWIADMEVTRYLGRRTGAALYQEVDFFKKVGEAKDTVLWIIEADGETVGATGIHEIDWVNAHATTGILIGAKDKWGKGIACRSDAPAHALRVPRVEPAQAHDRGLRGERREQASAREERLPPVGVRKDHFFTGGMWHDVWLGEVTREEWMAANP